MREIYVEMECAEQYIMYHIFTIVSVVQIYQMLPLDKLLH